MDQAQVLQCIRETATKLGVDPDLATAIAMVESGGWPLAVRFEPKWKYFYQIEFFAHKNGSSVVTEQFLQACSFGPMQIMGTVARELGHQGPMLELVAKPPLAVELSIRHLRGFLNKHDSVPSAVAAYNAGTPKKLEVGPGAGVKFVNQAYVDKVLARMKLLKKI